MVQYKYFTRAHSFYPPRIIICHSVCLMQCGGTPTTRLLFKTFCFMQRYAGPAALGETPLVIQYFARGVKNYRLIGNSSNYLILEMVCSGLLRFLGLRLSYLTQALPLFSHCVYCSVESIIDKLILTFGGLIWGGNFGNNLISIPVHCRLCGILPHVSMLALRLLLGLWTLPFAWEHHLHFCSFWHGGLVPDPSLVKSCSGLLRSLQLETCLLYGSSLSIAINCRMFAFDPDEDIVRTLVLAYMIRVDSLRWRYVWIPSWWNFDRLVTFDVTFVPMFLIDYVD